MKTNKILAVGLVATTVFTLGLSGTFANGGGALSEYVTDDEKAKIHTLSQEEKKEYINELKAKYNISDSGSNKQQGKGKGKNNDSHNSGDMLSNVPISDLTDTEREILSYGSSEERLARDVYDYMYNLYGEEIFNKISDSEQKHMDAVDSLLERYNLEGPTGYGDLEDTYNALIEEGSQGLKEALEVGLKIEALDIRDIDTAISNTDNDDFKIVFINIGGASYNHMKSFLNALKDNGFETDIDTSEFLSEDELSLKGPLKYKLAERMEAKGISLPEQVSSAVLKTKGPQSNNSNEGTKGKNNNSKKGNSNNVKSQESISLQSKYKETYQEKYGTVISNMDDEKLTELISKIDDILVKIENGNYSDSIKIKYNAMLGALKEIAEENLDYDNIFGGLFE